MNTCDVCKQEKYTADNPFVQARTPRPSNPSCLTCILAGHLKCLLGEKTDAKNLPMIIDLLNCAGGTATPEQWEAWMNSGRGHKAGITSLG